MWMIGYSNSKDGDADLNLSGRKHRSSFEATCSTTNNINATSAPFFGTAAPLQATNFFSINHHPIGIEQGRSHHHQHQHQRDYTNINNTQSVVQSSRWNPTPEQLMTLEDLYRRGTRTPSAEQIQHITAQLRRYGKIEGKNVFYWFQNHKARERQKRRRQQIESESDQQHDREDIHGVQGASKTEVFKVEQTKNCPIITKFAEQEEVVSLRRDEIGWVQGELEMKHSYSNTTSIKNGTWQMRQLSCPLVMSTERSISSSHHHDLNTSTTLEMKKKKKMKSQALELFPLQTIHEKNAIHKPTPPAPFHYFDFLSPKP